MTSSRDTAGLTAAAREEGGRPPAIEAVNLTKRYRPHAPEAGFALIPWLSPRRRREDRRARDGSRQGTIGDDDAFDADDDFDLGDVDEDLPEGTALRDRDVWALRDVSFTLKPGSVLGVIGGDGAGKSTLIRILQRISPPTSGYAVTRGRVGPTYSIAASMLTGNKSGLACIFQVARFFGIPHWVGEAAVGPIRQLTELGDTLDLPTRGYSSGELQRLAYAITLCLDPDILLFDGMPSVGDPAFRARGLAALQARIDQGLTVVTATRDLARPSGFYTHALWLKEGRVEALGSVDDVARRYERDLAAQATGRVRATLEREAAPEAPISPVAINTASIYSMEGRPIETMRSTDDALFEVTVDVREVPKRLRCVMALLADRKRRVRIAQPTHFDATEPGVYAATVHLPPGTVSPGSYRGKVRILELVDEERRNVDQTEFELTALSTGERLPKSADPSRLVWDVVRLS